jgi:spore maturation protein CgeB
LLNGDEGWKELLHGIEIKGRLDYYGPLADHYRTSAINLNITSAQMKTGLNQRVFDVPACRAFLLTDDRGQLHDHFEADEVVTYREPRDAAEKANWYLKRPDEREKIAKKAYRRILNEHLYVHRLEKIMKAVMGAAR